MPSLIANQELATETDDVFPLVNMTGPTLYYLKSSERFKFLRLFALWRGGYIRLPSLQIDQEQLRVKVRSYFGRDRNFQLLSMEDWSPGGPMTPAVQYVSRDEYRDCSMVAAFGGFASLLVFDLLLRQEPFRLEVGPSGLFAFKWPNAVPNVREHQSRNLTAEVLDQLLAYLQVIGTAMRPGRSGRAVLGENGPQIAIEFGYLVDGRTWACGEIASAE